MIGVMLDTVNSLVSGKPWELEKVSVSRPIHLRELFPQADTQGANFSFSKVSASAYKRVSAYGNV